MNDSPALRLHPPSALRAASTDVGVAILGAGFAGICMAIKLVEAGHDNIVVFEKASELGGTWRDNTYPGCSCDVPAHLYSYSFAQDPGWTRKYPRQPEILDYIRRVADRHDITRRIVFNTPIKSLTWDDQTSQWRMVARDGRRFTARVVVSAVGALHEPKIPDLPGLASFAGPAFHSARWRHDIDLAGKRVAVIGTGASAIQIIPEIAPQVVKLTVFQRSPPWVLPRRDRPVTKLFRRLLAGIPGLLRGWRALQYLSAERIAIGLTYKPKLMGTGQRESARYKELAIADPTLRLKLNPLYTLGCKRILLSDDFYATMARPNVDLVTEAIREVRPQAIVTADGREHPCDVLIHATGFQAFDHSARMTVRGRAGRLLADEWHDGPQAFHGVTVAGFPNYFLLMGPNTGLGHNSVIFMIEQQVKYVMQCLRWLDEGRLATVEVRPEVQRAYNESLQERFQRTVWRDTSNGSSWQLPCSSWYVNTSGRNTALWPGPSLTYWLTMRRASMSNYLPATEASPAVPDAGSQPERRAA